LVADAISGLSATGFVWSLSIAVALSLLIAFIEIPSKSKSQFRACLVGSSFFYWLVLSFGNVITTLLASLAVAKLPASLALYYPLLTPFFGVFGFETVLKNTNITMFDKGVLTIKDWIDKAANVAVAAAIAKQEDLNEKERNVLITQLMKLSAKEINTRILTKLGSQAVGELDAAAKASAADPKLYKVFQLVSTLSRSERAALRSAKGYREETVRGTFPTIHFTNPNQAPHNVTTLVIVTGSGFTGTQSVKFGYAVASFTPKSDGQLTTATPTVAVPGPVSLTVTTKAGSASIPFTFT
jgi:hypothetical protein